MHLKEEGKEKDAKFNQSNQQQRIKVSYVPQKLNLYAWGKGTDGQLGIKGATKGSQTLSVPTIVSFGNSEADLLLKEVACGHSFTAVTTDTGKLYTWGANNSGQLGNGSTVSTELPDLASTAQGLNIRKIACGNTHLVCLTDAGKIYCSGGQEFGQCGRSSTDSSPKLLPTRTLDKQNLIDISCGSFHTLVLTSEQFPFAMGNNEFGQLGVGGKHLAPKPMECFMGRLVSKIACGENHSVFIVDYRAYVTGKGSNGQLGLGDKVNVGKKTKLIAPSLVQSLKDKTIIDVAAGKEHSLFLTEEGLLLSCGSSSEGQCGVGTRQAMVKSPTLAQIDKSFRQVYACNNYSAAITDNGQLYTWGNGRGLKLGHGDDHDELAPRLVTELHNVCVHKVGLGFHHMAALVESVSPVVNDVRTLVNNQQFSDVLFVVQGGKLYAHRAILAIRSEKFRELFQQYSSVSIEIPNSFDAFYKLLEFIYTDDIKNTLSAAHQEELLELSRQFSLPRLTHLCEIFLTKPEAPMAFPKSIESDLVTALNNSSFSDFTINVQNKKIFAHKCILSGKCGLENDLTSTARSAYFKKILGAGMKEEKQSEIDIVDVRYEVFYEMLQFIYSGTTTLAPDNVVELWMIADQYRMNNLRQLCENLILHSIDINNVCSVIGLAYAYESGALINHCLEFIPKCFREIESTEDFQNLPEEVQDMIWEKVEPPQQEESNTMSVSAVLERLKVDIQSDIYYDNATEAAFTAEEGLYERDDKTYNYSLDELATLTSLKRGEIVETNEEEYYEEYEEEEYYEEYEENSVDPNNNNNTSETVPSRSVDIILKEFGQALQQKRTNKGFSRRVMCFYSGVKEAIIADYENGKEVPKRKDLVAFQNLLRVDFRPYLKELNLDWVDTANLAPERKRITSRKHRWQ